MSSGANNDELRDSISLTRLLTDEYRNYREQVESSGRMVSQMNTSWKTTTKLIEEYNNAISSAHDIYEDTGDLLKQQLKDTEKIIETVSKKSKLNEADKQKVLETLKARRDDYKVMIKQRSVQDSITSKAGEMLDTLESQVKKIPIIGDILASSIDFDGLKKQMGGIIGGITENFISLKAANMSTGAAISQSFGAALPLLKSFGRMLLASLGPIMLVVAALYLIKKAFDFNEETTKLAKDLGISVDEARDMEQSFNNMSASSSNLNVNTKSLVEAQKQLSSATGLTAEFSEQMLTDQIQLTKFMGLTGDEAANFQKIAIGNNQTAREMQGEIAGSVEQFNKATGASVSLKDVVQDIAKLPTDIRAGFKGTTAELAKTISLAKAMGTTLEKSVAAGKATLDIETSLKNEAQARILTGVSINNNAIRAAQLAGNQAEVLRLQKEEMKKIGDIGDYLPYQQEALAAAMGMSTSELVEQSEQMKLLEKVGGDLSKATLDEIKNNSDLTDEQKDQLIQQKEQVSAQEKLNALKQKFGDVINKIVSGPLGSMVGLIVDILVPAVEGLMFVFDLIMTPVSFIATKFREMVDFLTQAKDVLSVFLITFGTLLAYKERTLIIDGLTLGYEFAKNSAAVVYNGIIAAGNLIKKQGLFSAVAEMAMRAFSSLSAIPIIGPVLGIAGAAAAAALGYSYLSKADDMMAPAGYGDRVLTGPEGSIALNNKDSVIAGTDLFGGGQSSENTAGGTSQMGAIFQQLVSEVRGLRSDIQAQPIMITVDGKVVSQITRVQSKQSSFRK